jgi:ribonuclease III
MSVHQLPPFQLPPFQLPQFKNTEFFEQAMTHRSFANEVGEPELSNERMEFLGDCVLNFVTGDFLYEYFPTKSEGELTTLRAAIVNETQVAEFARGLELAQYLKIGKGAKRDRVQERSSVLSSTFEALIGAYYLDCQGEIEEIRIYLEPILESVVDRLAESAPRVNYKSLLQNFAQVEYQQMPEYRIISATGPDHAKEFVCEVSIAGQFQGRGTGPSKQIAEKAAAQDALKHLGELE